MPPPDRSPFSALLAAHRRRLGLTQAELAGRTGRGARSVSERTIVSLENASASRPRVPRPGTIRALAAALELAPGSPEREAFFAAAAGAPPAQPRPVTPEPERRAAPDAEFIVAGREAQLDRLLAAVDTLVTGAPDVVLVTGGAGAGKSRLIDEACHRAIASHPDVAVLWTACRPSFGTVTALEPFRLLLAEVARDPLARGVDDLPRENANRLDARLTTAIDALTTRADALVGTLIPPEALERPSLAERVGPVLAGRLRETIARRAGKPVDASEVDAAIQRLLAAYAQFGPLLLVVEDLHWADSATLGVLTHLIERLAQRGLPILLLGSTRTGADGPGAGGASGSLSRLIEHATAAFPATVVDLEAAVGGSEGRAFVDAAVARLPGANGEAFAERLFARTGGWPLFVMSFLRLHLDHPGELDTEDEVIPGEIGTLFARQLARLDPPAHDLIDAASVQGEEFLAEIAARAAGTSPATLDTALAGLARPLGASGQRNEPELHRYRFEHALLRDHVYHALSDLHRAHLHAATAEALIDALGEHGHDAVEVIAYHLERAGETGRSAAAWMQAGDRSMQRSDFEHSRAIFQHVRGMGIERTDPARHVQALLGIGNSDRGLGRPGQARRAILRARDAATRRGLHTVRANALTSLGVLDFDEGDMLAGAARFAEAIEAHARAGDLVEAGRATANLSFTLHGMGRYDEALARAVQAIGLANETGDTAVKATAEIAHANCWLDLGYYEHATDLYAANLEAAEELGLTHHANLCMLNIALCNIELERWDAADAALSRMREPDRNVVERLRSVVAFNGGLVAEGRGEADQARRLFDSSREIRARLGQEPLQIDSLAGLLRVATVAGDRSVARSLVVEIEDRLAAHGYIGIEHLGRLFVALAESHQGHGDVAAASAWLRRAVGLLDERASLLSDPDHRRSYLSRPPAHRRVLELAGRAGLPLPPLDPEDR